MSQDPGVTTLLDDAERNLRGVGGWDNSLVNIPAGGVRKLIQDLRAALATQPEAAPEAPAQAAQSAGEVEQDDSEGSWKALPDRLRGRGDWLKERGRIKDAELMFDAATEIEGNRAALSHKESRA